MPDEFDEEGYRSWYQEILDEKAKEGFTLNSDPDDLRHFYDHRAAYSDGMKPTGGHGSSRYKLPGHPRMFLKMKQLDTGEFVEDDDGEYYDTRSMTLGTEQQVKDNDRSRESVMLLLERLKQAELKMPTNKER